MRIPFVQQMEAVECGAACLTMILRGFGHHAELSELREACGVSRDGVSAKSVVRVARDYGLTTRARSIEPEELADLEQPAIIHWEMNHFVILKKWTPTHAELLDPAVGPRKVSAEDFDKSFTGICIELGPSDTFETRPRRRLSLGRYLAILKGARVPLGVIAMASAMINVLGLTVPITTQVVVDRVLTQEQTTWLPYVAGLALALIVLWLALDLLRAWVLKGVRLHLDSEIGEGLVRHLLTLPMRFFMQRHTGDLVGRVRSTKRIRDLLAGQSVTLLVDGALLVSYLVLMLLYEARLGLLVLGAAIIYVGLYALARPEQLNRYRERVIKDVRQDVQLLQTVQGMLTLKSAGREQVAHARWLHLLVAALNAKVREVRLGEGVSTGLMLVRIATPLCVLAYGASLVAAGELSLGMLLGVLLIQTRFLEPLGKIVETLLSVQQLPVMLARTDDVLDTEPERTGHKRAPRLTGAIRLEEVTFKYGPTSPPVLDGLTLEIARGEKVALVGPSGSGKSTVARLLLGLYAPAEGEIFLDAHPLDELDLMSVRRQLGAVLQETKLFDGTIRENVSLYDPSARLEDVVAACRVAQIHEDIEALPKGYDTRVSASSGPLSGGQRQRLALARAVLHRPPIMLLDEATSALDSVTEAAVERYLSTRSCTRLVIAHRLSTVRDADRIVVLDRGKIVEQGRHEDLVAAGALYAELVARGEDQRKVERAVSKTDEIGAGDLDGFEAFASLDTEGRRSLAERLKRRVVPEGTVLLRQRERGAGLYFLEKGELRVVIEEPGLEPLEVGRVGEGTIVGEVGLLDGSPASATLEATGEVRCLHLPLKDFEQLRDQRDPLALTLIVSLGRLVAQRIRETTKRREKVGHSGAFEAKDDEEALSDQPATNSGAAMRVADTALGGSLTDDELERIGELGEEHALEPGEVLFRKGDPGSRSYVVLAGRIAVTLESVEGYLNVIKPGELFGEIGAFDDGDRTAGCVAVEPSKVFSIDHVALHKLLADGSPGAWKVLRHLVHSLVRVLRISTLRLREAIALQNGEDESAMRAREQARELARSRDLALTAERDSRRLPVVSCEEPELSGAACLTSVLRHFGRAVPFVTVSEATSENGVITGASLARGARSFGLLCRRLSLDGDDLRFMSSPLLLRDTEGGFMVAEAWRGGGLLVMDPTRGRRRLDRAALDEHLDGACFEIRPDDAKGKQEGLWPRLVRAVRAQRHVFGPVVGASVSIQILGLAFPTALGLVIAQVLPSGDLGLLGTLTAAVVAVIVVQAVLHWLRSHALIFLRTRLDATLLDQLMRHVLQLSIPYFERTAPAHVMQHFASFRVLRELVGSQGIRAALELPLLVLALGYIALVDPALLLVAAAAVALQLVVLVMVIPRIGELATEELSAGADAQESLIEAIGGIATLRICGEGEAGLRRWLPHYRRELVASVGQDGALLASLALLEAIGQAMLVAMVWWGATRVLDGQLSLGGLMAVASAAGALALTFEGLTGTAIAFSRAFERVRQVNAMFLREGEQKSATVSPPGRLRGRIQLDHVSFAYAEDAPLVIDDVSLTIEPGSKVALVGASGSGKSTLGKLLLGFYLPRAGRVTFDGKDLSGLDLGELRSQIGVVLQDAFIFSGTVRDNLTINAPGSELGPLMRAARAAHIHRDIARLPMGYDTLVSEGGTSFSGGQRQRLALARALVHDPAVLLLDEATSALDNVSQAVVEDNLAQLSCTRIVIAHRLSTVVDADQIVVLDHGRVVQTGTHDEMMVTPGPYRTLVEAQLA